MKKQESIVSEMSQDSMKQVIFRLAHFDPSSKDEYGHQVIDYLVLDSLTTYGRLKVTAQEITIDIKTRFYLDFEESEIIRSGQRLSQRVYRLVGWIKQRDPTLIFYLVSPFLWQDSQEDNTPCQNNTSTPKTYSPACNTASPRL